MATADTKVGAGGGGTSISSIASSGGGGGGSELEEAAVASGLFPNPVPDDGGELRRGLKRQRLEIDTRSVISSSPAPFKLKQTKQPISQQSNVILNAEASMQIMKARKMLYQTSEAGNHVTSEFPDGSPGVWNILPRELVFRSVKKAPSDKRFVLPSISYGNDAVWSSFNLLPPNEEPVFVGVADTAVIMNLQSAQSLSFGLSVAISGTRSLMIGPEVVHLGDRLYWDYPYSVQKPNEPERRPLQMDGTPGDKFLAWIRPLDFKNWGSKGMGRNVAAWMLGTWDPPANINKHFDAYKKYALLIELLYMKDADSGVREQMAKYIATVSGRPDTDILNEIQNLATHLIAQLPEADRTDSDKLQDVGRRAIARCILLNMEFARQDHYNHFMTRSIGTSLGTGVNASVGVYVRGGLAY